MGYTTREVESVSLNPQYPAHYREMQIHNWTPTKIVITYLDGHQVELPEWPKVTKSPYVDLEFRETTGMRVTTDQSGHQHEVPIPTKKFTVMYSDFLLYPVKIEEIGIIISTVDHSLLAKNMLIESGYSPDANESLSDFETTDPRFVFEVKDPFNRWEELYLNVLGQTITLRCGHSNQIITDLDEDATKALAEHCTLSCYLRYPSNYAQAERPTVQVFTLNLSDLDLEEPYLLPSGDVICIASTHEALQRVMSKKHEGNASANVQISGLVSKDLHDRTVKDLQNQIEAEKQSNTQQLRNLRMQKDAEIAELKYKLDEEKRTSTSQKQQLEYWSALHESSIERFSREDKLSLQREKLRQEQSDNSRKDTEAVWDALKIGGAAASAVITFALAMFIKSSKK